ncbi:MAG: hypothetical protein JXA95_08640 [Spirochaetales bacterium]|nr:hypothetical protein [Spirochaetales bacterium]
MKLPARRHSSPFGMTIIDTRGDERRLTADKLFRIRGDKDYTIRIDAPDSSGGKVYLRGNLEGGDFETFPMIRCSDNPNCWRFEGNLPRGGFIKITSFLETEKARYWDPVGYREILVDPPLMNNLRMYSFIPGVSGRFEHWIRDLDHITEMGFNALHLLPLTEMGYTRSPYAARDLYRIDRAYGSKEDFELFIRTCIKKELALCFDVVLNHVSCDSDLAVNRAHWIQGDPRRKDGMKRAGCWHGGDWISWEELVLIDYDHPDPKTRREIWETMRDYLFYWAALAERTGGFIRLDNLHSSHQGFIAWALDDLRREYPGVGIFSEFFHSEEELQRGVKAWGLNLLLANSWEYSFVPPLREYLKSIHAMPELRYLLMPTTHDTESVRRLFGESGSVVPRYFVCALMGSGQTGLTMGTEWGEPEKIDFINRSGRVRFIREWDFSEAIKKINTLQQNHDIFHRTGNIEFLNPSTDSILVCRRSTKNGKGELLLAANFDTRNKKEYHYHQKGNLLMEQGAVLENTEWGCRVELAPCGVAVLEI